MTRAQSLAETALLLPVLLLFLLTVIDLARVFSTYYALQAGTREAASYAGAHPEDPAGYAAAFAREGGLPGSWATLVTDTSRVTVTAATDFRLAFLPMTVPLRTRVVWPWTWMTIPCPNDPGTCKATLVE